MLLLLLLLLSSLKLVQKIAARGTEPLKERGKWPCRCLDCCCWSCCSFDVVVRCCCRLMLLSLGVVVVWGCCCRFCLLWLLLLSPFVAVKLRMYILSKGLVTRNWIICGKFLNKMLAQYSQKLLINFGLTLMAYIYLFIL